MATATSASGVAPGIAGGCERRRVDEGRQRRQAEAAQRLQPAPVAGRQADVDGGAGQPCRHVGLGLPPCADAAPRRKRGLGGHVGDACLGGERRAQPVRRLVVGMVGEEEVGPALSRPERREACPLGSRRAAGLGIVRGIRLGAEAAQLGCERDLVAGAFQRADDQPRHLAVARGDGVARRFQRGVEGDAHGRPSLSGERPLLSI